MTIKDSDSGIESLTKVRYTGATLFMDVLYFNDAFYILIQFCPAATLNDRGVK